MVAVRKDKLNGDAIGTGRRKTSVARVRLRAGAGTITINGRELEKYFPNFKDQKCVLDALELTGLKGQISVLIRVSGGGATGQSGACKMGLARAICSYDMEKFPALRDSGFLTRDSRMKERKKYGLRGARRGVQFSKR